MIDGYLLATTHLRPVSVKALKEALQDEGVELVQEEGVMLSVRVNGARTDVSFEKLTKPIRFSPDFVTGSDEGLDLLKKAKAVYRIAFEPGAPQASVAVFEALWVVRALMEKVEGVLLDLTAYKVHDPVDVQEITELEFDIRDHINLHAVEATDTDTPLWVHTHGMEKFGSRDLETFNLAEADLPAAESFLHRLCTDLAFGQGPAARAAVETGEGQAFMLIPSEEARNNLMGVPLDTFEGHEGLYFTVVAASGRHTIADLLKPFRDRFEQEAPEKTEALQEQANELLPSFKARFLRKGLMEPIQFIVRAPFDVHPDGKTVQESLWAEILTWDDQALIGKLVDGSAQTTEWRKGATVQLGEKQINAIAISRDGEVLDDDEMKGLLLAERPM